MDPANDIAQTTGGTSGVNNANLYFFSWGAFLMSFVVLMHYMKEKKGPDKEDSSNKNKEFNLGSWAVLAAASFVVMAACK
jgi:hypothetical protein